MHRNKLIWITLLMTFSLIGIISFQAYWMSLSIKEKLQDLNASVIQAIAKTTDDIKEKEAYFFVSDLKLNSAGINSYQTSKSRVFSKDSITTTSTEVKIVVNNSNNLLDVSLNEQEADTILKLSDNKTIKRGIKVLGNANIDTTFENIDLQVIELNDSILTKIELLQTFENKKEDLKKAVEQVAFDFVISDKTIEERIKEIPLDSILAQNLKSSGIGSNQYEYQIVDTASDSVILASDSYSNSSTTYSDAILTTESSKAILNLEFPNMMGYILGQIWVSMLISLVLVLLIIFTFYYTIKAIFQQKKPSTMKSDFINNITHEFKTPVATIDIAIDTIMHEGTIQDRDQIQHLGAIIKKENQRINQHVEKVIEVSQMDHDQLSFELVPKHLHPIIEDCLRSLEISLTKASVELIIKLDAEKDYVKLDAFHFCNILNNLVDNAIKYSNDNKFLSISTFNSENQIIIAIEDKGIGMSSSTLEKIYDKFYRENSGDLHAVKGFGLGLTYVKFAIEKMNGSIHFDSKVGIGTKCILKFDLYD